MWEIPDYGLWYLLPASIQTGMLGRIMGLVFTSVIVYAMVEFSNSLVLLRVSSRMLSTTFAILMAICLCLHKFQPAHIVMFSTLLSYLFLFSSYQKPSPALSFTTHLFLSLASLVCPKMLLLVVPVWIFQIQLSALNFRSFIASLIAIATPYWFFFGFAVLTDRLDVFVEFFKDACDIIMPNADNIKENQVLACVFTAFTFILGAIHFVFTRSQDKLRQRTIYDIVMMHGIIVLIAFVFMPHCFNLLLGMLIVDASIIGGRFWVVTDNKFTNNLFVFQIILAGIIIALSINM